MWNPGLDPGQDRWGPALDPRWDVESWVGPWAGQAGSRLGSQVGGGILPRIPVGGDHSFDPGRDPALDPGWEAGSRLNPAWLFNWGFCRHHSILKSYLTTFTSSPMRQIYFHLTMIRQRERTLRQICRRSQNISHRIFTD